MKAMVLAAGLGTRLRPLTNDRPKALVEVAGRTLLEICLNRLRDFGVSDVIVNVHHFAEMVEAYLKANNNFGLRIAISREEILLDTGGGLKKAGYFFMKGAGSEEPFIVHNVDVISNINFKEMLEFHGSKKALATLAVQRRETSRSLLFDESLELCGRRTGNEAPQLVRSAPNLQALAFSGIHVISPRFLAMMSQQGAFSIIDSYLSAASTGEKIVGFRADEYYWRDLGKPEQIEQAGEDIASKIFS